MAVVPHPRKNGTVAYYVVTRWMGRLCWEPAGTVKREAQQIDSLRKREKKLGTFTPKRRVSGGKLTIRAFIDEVVVLRERKVRNAKDEMSWCYRHVLNRKWLADAPMGDVRTGAVQAGCRVAWAGNHWPLAVETHALNHPDTEHVCQDLRQADWGQLPEHYDLLWASPACQGHSTNSQPRRRPKHDADRATAWAVVDCAEATRPGLLVVENVPNFENWPLFPEWRACLVKLGYELQLHTLSATAFGVPQRRTRLVIVGSRKPLALRLPGAPKQEPAFGPLLQRTHKWRPFEQAQPKARARMLNALRRQGNRRCLVQHVTGHPGVPLREPIRTITTKAQWVLVDPTRGYRWLSLRELARAQGFDDSFRLPAGVSLDDGRRLLGNAVPPPLARGVIRAIQEAA